MEFLTSGVLEKVFREMGMGKKAEENQKPFLLQIRTIIPVSAEGDLWPNQGFYLNVSDSSHALFVSLPQEQNEMVLCNKLRLGQLIYVEELESSDPVPMLRGVKAVPGRFPCLGNPQDLVSIEKLDNLRGLSDPALKMENQVSQKKKKPRERSQSSTASKVRPGENTARISGYCDVKKDISDLKKAIKEYDSNFVDITLSTPSSTPAKRRSWTGRESLDASIVKEWMRTTDRTSTASTAPPRAPRYDSSEENSKSRTRVKYNGSATKSIRSSNQSKTSATVKYCEKSMDPTSMFSSGSDKKMEETGILWNSLPSILVKHGKEVLRLKEAAVLAAVDVLQEASAAERILKCLSSYSMLQLAKADNQQSSVDKLFNLQNDMDQTLLIVQSLKSISPLRENDGDPSSPGSISEALKLALERKKNAASWVKAALLSDLNPISSSDNVPFQATNTTKKPITDFNQKPKVMNLGRMRRNKEMHIGWAAECSSPDWVKGSTIDAAAQLSRTLQNECKKWFLAYVEDYLDEVKSKTPFKSSDVEVAEIMRQIKKVNDWLDMMVGRKGGSILGDSEWKAYGRVRDKIYAILLQNVERTAMALEHTNAIDGC